MSQSQFKQGSPPRVRGIGIVSIENLPRFGITPARAGNSMRVSPSFDSYVDHPRACGE